jgi:hypothetical protein
VEAHLRLGGDGVGLGPHERIPLGERGLLVQVRLLDRVIGDDEVERVEEELRCF